jgi:hypothetical protein
MYNRDMKKKFPIFGTVCWVVLLTFLGVFAYQVGNAKSKPGPDDSIAPSTNELVCVYRKSSTWTEDSTEILLDTQSGRRILVVKTRRGVSTLLLPEKSVDNEASGR